MNLGSSWILNVRSQDFATELHAQFSAIRPPLPLRKPTNAFDEAVCEFFDEQILNAQIGHLKNSDGTLQETKIFLVLLQPRSLRDCISHSKTWYRTNYARVLAHDDHVLLHPHFPIK